MQNLDFTRTAVIGCAGSGKTTFSVSLANILQRQAVHLDRELWSSDWQMKEDREQIHSRIISEESWLIDGMWGSLLVPRFQRATLVIFLDYPTFLCLRRAEKRRKQNKGVQRFDMAEGCIDGKKDKEFVKWIRCYRKVTRPKVYALHGENPSVQFVVLKTPRQTKRFLQQIANAKAQCTL